MTVYRHFPDREAIARGLWEDVAASQDLETGFPAHLRDLNSVLRGIHNVGYSRGELAVLAIPTPAGKALRRALRQRHVDAYADIVDDAVKALPDRDRTLARAVFLLFQSSSAWLELQGNKKLDAPDVVRAVRWAVETLTQDLKARDRLALDLTMSD